MMDAVALAELVGAYPHRHVVITGGEPMIYAEQVAVICEVAEKMGKVVTIETNGTIWDKRVKPALWSVSPKLASSTPGPEHPAERALHLKNVALPVAYSQFKRLKVQFKFVATSQSDVDEVEALEQRHRLAPSDVWMMPEGRTRDDVLERGVWLAEACKSKGWNLCLRQHVLLWGNKRGV